MTVVDARDTVVEVLVAEELAAVVVHSVVVSSSLRVDVWYLSRLADSKMQFERWG